VTWAAAVLLLFAYVLIGYPLAFWRRGGEPVQAAYIVGLAPIVAAAAIARVWNRRAVVALSTMYVAAWIGLLAWNAERARHFVGEGL
jgi:UDP-N-acetylmuramyl pentapeptide phosphotransferase/UDP-N-acetylglucosamine-1-phosphate transferase